jgi:hypothetical protein
MIIISNNIFISVKLTMISIQINQRKLYIDYNLPSLWHPLNLSSDNHKRFNKQFD